MHVTLRQLQLLQAVADTGSITAASQAMFVTQPTVSMQLQQLAENVGMPLYEVQGRQVVLTEVGHLLVDTSRDIFARWEAFENDVAAIQGLTKGKLRVAVVTTAKYFIPRMLGPFSRQYPDIDISLDVDNRDRVVQSLEAGEADVFIMTTPPPAQRLKIQRLLPNPVVLIAAIDHPLANKRRIKRERLLNERFILREPGSGTRITCERWFKQWAFEPESRFEFGSNEAIREAVAGGFGVAVLSRHALDRDPHHDGLAILDVQGFPIASNWYLVTREDRRVSPVSLAFEQFLLKSLEQKAV